MYVGGDSPVEEYPFYQQMDPSCDYCNTYESENTTLQRCSGCKIALYCNQACQQKDWEKHKIKCLKYKKEQSEEKKLDSDVENSETCWACNKSAKKLHDCALCHMARYCSKNCEEKNARRHILFCDQWSGFKGPFSKKIRPTCRQINDWNDKQLAQFFVTLGQLELERHALKHAYNNIKEKKT